MPARLLCQKFFKNVLEPLHLYRQKSLIDATSAVINGASLTLTRIGRQKRVAPRLGNSYLQNEVSTVFQRVTRKMTQGMSRAVILIDWSAYHASRFQLLRASLACDGIFADFVFGWDYDMFGDGSKLRRTGFHGYRTTDNMFCHLFNRFRAARIIP